MSQNKLLLPILGAAVVAGGGGAAYFIATSQPGTVFAPNQIAPAPVAGVTTVVPAKAIALVTINTDGAAFKQLEQFLSPEANQLFQQSLQQLDNPLAQDDLDITKELQALAGGQVLIALFPSTPPTARRPRLYAPVSFRDGSNWQTAQNETPESPTAPDFVPNFVVVAEVKDKAAVEAFLGKMRANGEVKTKTSDYKGVAITLPETPAPDGMVSAVVNDFLVLSNTEASVQAVIDTAEGATSISGALPRAGLSVENPLFGFYLPNVSQNAPALAEIISKANAEATLPPNFVSQLRSINSFGMVGGVDGQGFRVRSSVQYSTDVPSGNSANKLLSLLPSTTIGLFTGINIRDQWAFNVKLAENNPQLKEAIEFLRTSAKSEPFNLDLDKDVFSWMDGEHAFAVIPSSEGVLAGVGVGPVVMFQTSNRAAAEALLKKLDEISQRTGARVSTRDVGGVQVTEHTDPSGSIVFAAHGWLQPDIVFIGAAPLVPALTPKPATPLSDDANYKAVIANLAGNNTGYFFVDMPKLMAVITKQVPADALDKQALSLVQSIRGIGVSQVMPDPRTSLFDILIAMKKPAQ